MREEEEEGRRIDGKKELAASLPACWPDGQLFGREMRKFVHSWGRKRVLSFQGVESCDSDVSDEKSARSPSRRFHV